MISSMWQKWSVPCDSHLNFVITAVQHPCTVPLQVFVIKSCCQFSVCPVHLVPRKVLSLAVTGAVARKRKRRGNNRDKPHYTLISSARWYTFQEIFIFIWHNMPQEQTCLMLNKPQWWQQRHLWHNAVCKLKKTNKKTTKHTMTSFSKHWRNRMNHFKYHPNISWTMTSLLWHHYYDIIQ